VNSDVTIRRMILADVESVFQIQESLGFEHWPLSEFEEELLRPYIFAFSLEVVENGEKKIAGYAVFSLAADEVELLAIAVVRTWQHRGMAQKLFDFGITVLLRVGAKKVFLEVRRGNTPAISLYQKLGFLQIGVRKKYYDDKEDALLMSLSLGTGA